MGLLESDERRRRGDRPPRRVIVVHGLDHAMAAAEAASACDRALVLASAPAAAGYAGAAWFREILAAVETSYPDLDLTGILDCGDRPGHVLGALRDGAKHVRFTGEEETARRLADIARQQGAELVTSEVEALDLAAEDSPAEACRAWLSR